MEPQSAAASPRPIGLEPVSLRELSFISGATVSTVGERGGGDSVVTGVTLRSGDVRAGDLFVARAGSRAHGAVYAGDAARRGAAAILTDADGYRTVLQDGAAAALPVLLADDPRAILGDVSAAVYHYPSRTLKVIGITGTAGKTTTCYLLEGALRAAGSTVGVIGTVGTRINGRPVASNLTTPEAPDLQALFAVMMQAGVDTVAIEVSSHALALGRVAGTEFSVAAFTNLSQDHLDFHGDMEHYFAAKKLLFDGRARREVIVIDDAWGRQLAAERPGAVTISSNDPDAASAHWRVWSEPTEGATQRVHLTGPERAEMTASLLLPGRFNAVNAATAIACAAEAGWDPRRALPGVETVQVPGRMQRIDRGQGFIAIVDYAHKPAALAQVLRAARRDTARSLIVVLGAGGDRDHGKRAAMGRIAAEEADIVIVTDDNPRTEDPADIRAEVLAGVREVRSGGEQVHDIGDRRAAIQYAISVAAVGDTVLVAGKGHETGQEIAGVRRHFSDVEEVEAALQARAGRDVGEAGQITP